MTTTIDTKPFVIEKMLKASVEKVWTAITDPAQMKNWYFDLPDFKAKVGHEFSFLGGPPDGIQYLHKCKVTEVIPKKKLAYTWRYEDYEGESLVSFELFTTPEGTKLVLTHSGLHTFPADNTDFAKKNFAEGWTEITKALKSYLEK